MFLEVEIPGRLLRDDAHVMYVHLLEYQLEHFCKDLDQW